MYMGLIIKGTIPRVPPFSLWNLWIWITSYLLHLLNHHGSWFLMVSVARTHVQTRITNPPQKLPWRKWKFYSTMPSAKGLGFQKETLSSPPQHIFKTTIGLINLKLKKYTCTFINAYVFTGSRITNIYIYMNIEHYTVLKTMYILH